MLLGGSCLLDRVFDDEVEEEVVAAQGATDFAAALKVDEELLVHELNAVRRYMETSPYGMLPVSTSNHLNF